MKFSFRSSIVPFAFLLQRVSYIVIDLQGTEQTEPASDEVVVVEVTSSAPVTTTTSASTPVKAPLQTVTVATVSSTVTPITVTAPTTPITTSITTSPKSTSKPKVPMFSMMSTVAMLTGASDGVPKCSDGMQTSQQILIEKDKRAKEEAERIAKAEADRVAKLKAERLARVEANKAKMEADKRAREELARAEAERKAKVEANRVAKIEADKRAKEELAKADAERIAKEEAAIRAKVETNRLAKLEAEKLAKAEVEKRTMMAKEEIHVSPESLMLLDEDNFAFRDIVEPTRKKMKRKPTATVEEDVVMAEEKKPLEIPVILEEKQHAKTVAKTQPNLDLLSMKSPFAKPKIWQPPPDYINTAALQQEDGMDQAVDEKPAADAAMTEAPVAELKREPTATIATTAIPLSTTVTTTTTSPPPTAVTTATVHESIPVNSSLPVYFRQPRAPISLAPKPCVINIIKPDKEKISVVVENVSNVATVNETSTAATAKGLLY